jgi:hypothetical protein
VPGHAGHRHSPLGLPADSPRSLYACRLGRRRSHAMTGTKAAPAGPSQVSKPGQRTRSQAARSGSVPMRSPAIQPSDTAPAQTRMGKRLSSVAGGSRRRFARVHPARNISSKKVAWPFDSDLLQLYDVQLRPYQSNGSIRDASSGADRIAGDAASTDASQPRRSSANATKALINRISRRPASDRARRRCGANEEAVKRAKIGIAFEGTQRRRDGAPAGEANARDAGKAGLQCKTNFMKRFPLVRV